MFYNVHTPFGSILRAKKYIFLSFNFNLANVSWYFEIWNSSWFVKFIIGH